ncbi:hypothetical protein BHM03_00015037 [Ensete ventricosum]|nr:hypothetical protein BHM03_00015037 [Ensete ventricosum]
MNRAGKSAVWAGVGQELVAAAEWWAKELEGEFEKIQTELESLRSQQRELEQEIRLLHSSLDGARNDRACLEGDVLSLTEATVFLEAELKVEGQKAWPPTRHPEGSSLASRRWGGSAMSSGTEWRSSDFRGSTLI